MGTKTMTKNDFQTFEKKGEGNLYLSSQLNDVEYVYKYIPLVNFLKSYCGRYLYLADPKKWEDPFETKYLDLISKEPETYDKQCDIKVKATCFTPLSTKNEEASWKAYLGSGKDVLRVKIDFNALLNQLSNASKTIYVSKCVYKSRLNIVKGRIFVKPTKDDSNNQFDLFINNFSLKQTAYKYENEIRVCAISNDGTNIESEVKLDWDEILKEIVLPPSKEQGNNNLLRMVLMKINRDFIVKESALYDISSISMVK